MIPSPWTLKDDSILKVMWNEGATGSQIAGKLHGRTRNAVIGRIHRLGLASRPSPIPIRRPLPIPPNKITEPEPEPEQTKAPVSTHDEAETVEVNPTIDREIPVKKGKKLMDLAREDCRWPEGDPGTAGFFFCGAPAFRDKSYCAEHCLVAYHQRPKAERPFFRLEGQ